MGTEEEGVVTPALTPCPPGGYTPPVNPLSAAHPRRVRSPPHEPHPAVAQLRASGLTLDDIARGIGASMREVSRWAAGDSRPLRVYERELDRLLSASVAA